MEKSHQAIRNSPNPEDISPSERELELVGTGAMKRGIPCNEDIVHCRLHFMSMGPYLASSLTNGNKSEAGMNVALSIPSLEWM